MDEPVCFSWAGRRWLMPPPLDCLDAVPPRYKMTNDEIAVTCQSCKEEIWRQRRQNEERKEAERQDNIRKWRELYG